MKNEEFFTGRTEKFLLDMLKARGFIHVEEIFNAYSADSSAHSFMQKLITFNIARLSKPGMFTLENGPSNMG